MNEGMDSWGYYRDGFRAVEGSILSFPADKKQVVKTARGRMAMLYGLEGRVATPLRASLAANSQATIPQSSPVERHSSPKLQATGFPSRWRYVFRYAYLQASGL